MSWRPPRELSEASEQLTRDASAPAASALARAALASADPRAVGVLRPHCLAAPDAALAPLLDACARLLDGAPATVALALADEARRAPPAARVPALRDRGGLSGVALAALASLDRDGRVREAGALALADASGELARRFLWLRTDDTVAAVRQLAEARLAAVTRHLTPRALVGDLPLLDALHQRTRASRSLALRAALLTASRPDEALRGALRGGLASGDASLRAACARRLIEDGDLAARVEALRDALASPSPRAQLLAARQAFAPGAPGAVVEPLLPQALGHRLTSVRLRALRWLARRGGADDALLAATIDRDGAVRLEARRLLAREEGREAYRALAVAALTARDAPYERAMGALGALYEIGDAGDCAAVTARLWDARGRVRAEAIRTLGALAPGRYLDVFVAGLADGSRHVALASARALEGAVGREPRAAFLARLPLATLEALRTDSALRPPCRGAVDRVVAALTG